MSEYPSGNVEDRRMLEKLSNEKLLNFLFLHVRNLWRVDGLHFLDIEKKSGTEAAAQIDAQVWETTCIQLESHL
jgi:hypothetical protein